MSDDAKAADPNDFPPQCDHICLKDDGHVERGEAHFYGYEHPSPRAVLPSEGWEQAEEVEGLRSTLQMIGEYHRTGGPSDSILTVTSLVRHALRILDDCGPVYRRVDGAAPPEPERTYACDDCGWTWPLGEITLESECDACGGELVVQPAAPPEPERPVVYPQAVEAMEDVIVSARSLIGRLRGALADLVRACEEPGWADRGTEALAAAHELLVDGAVPPEPESEAQEFKRATEAEMAGLRERIAALSSTPTEVTLLQQLDAQTDETRRAGEEVVRLRAALSMAQSIILSGERMSATAQAQITAAPASSTPTGEEWDAAHAADVAYWTEWAERFPAGMVPVPAFVAALSGQQDTERTE